MKMYRLTIRPVSPKEISRECHHTPESDELENDLNIFSNCIQQNSSIINTAYAENLITIETSIEKNDLLKIMKPCFNKIPCYRFVDLILIKTKSLNQ